MAGKAWGVKYKPSNCDVLEKQILELEDMNGVLVLSPLYFWFWKLKPIKLLLL